MGGAGGGIYWFGLNSLRTWHFIYCVLMPLRALIDSDPWLRHDRRSQGNALGLNALTGIYWFGRTNRSTGRNFQPREVLMPLRAFIDSDTGGSRAWTGCWRRVLMPLRALIDSDGDFLPTEQPQRHDVLMPLRAFIDSDRHHCIRGGWSPLCVLMPLRAFIDSDPVLHCHLCTSNRKALMPLRAFIDSDVVLVTRLEVGSGS